MTITESSKNQYLLHFSGGTKDFYLDRASGLFPAEALRSMLEDGIPRFVLLYGPSGSGKTHLVRGFAQEYRLRHPGRAVCEMSLRDFTDALIEAIQCKEEAAFSASCAELDLLILDDMSDIAGKAATQTAVLNILRHLAAAGGDAVLVFDRLLPAYAPFISGIRQAAEGLEAGLGCPGAECRGRFARAWLAETRLSVPDRVAETFSRRLPSIPLLRGALAAYAAAGGTRDAEDILRLFTGMSPAEKASG